MISHEGMILLTLAIHHEFIVIHSLSGDLLYNKLLAKFPNILNSLFHRVVNITSTPVGVEGGDSNSKI